MPLHAPPPRQVVDASRWPSVPRDSAGDPFECSLLSRLPPHANVVRLLARARSRARGGRRTWMVLEYADLGTLQVGLRACVPRPASGSVCRAWGTGCAWRAAHAAHGAVHAMHAEPGPSRRRAPAPKPRQDALSDGWLLSGTNPDYCKIARTAADVASGMAHLHESGVVHGVSGALGIALFNAGVRGVFER